MLSDWAERCPRLFALHGPHLAPIYGMPEGPDRDALAELLELIDRCPFRLAAREVSVVLEWDEDQVGGHLDQLQRAGEIIREHHEAARQYLLPWLREARRG